MSGTVTYSGKKPKTTAAAAAPKEDVPWREAFDLARSKDCVYWEQLERVPFGLHKSHTIYSNMVQCKAIATGCKHIDADLREQRTRSTAPLHSSKEGPTCLFAYQATSTMASSVAKRFVAARTLNKGEHLHIDMRAQARLLLAPEAGAGRVTNVRTAPKLSGLETDPDASVSYADSLQCQLPGCWVYCVSPTAWPAVNWLA
eukprot:6197913-Pleurochrysis_carterae.AAC.6